MITTLIRFSNPCKKISTFRDCFESRNFFMYKTRLRLHLTQNFRRDRNETESLGVFFYETETIRKFQVRKKYFQNFRKNSFWRKNFINQRVFKVFLKKLLFHNVSKKQLSPSMDNNPGHKGLIFPFLYFYINCEQYHQRLILPRFCLKICQTIFFWQLS